MNVIKRLRLVLVLFGVLVLPGGGLPLLAVPPQSGQRAAAKAKTVQMRIAGMTCAACAKGLEASFRNMVGIVKAEVGYKSGQAVVTFDTTKQIAESLSKFIASCGYKLKETKVV